MMLLTRLQSAITWEDWKITNTHSHFQPQFSGTLGLGCSSRPSVIPTWFKDSIGQYNKLTGFHNMGYYGRKYFQVAPNLQVRTRENMHHWYLPTWVRKYTMKMGWKIGFTVLFCITNIFSSTSVSPCNNRNHFKFYYGKIVIIEWIQHVCSQAHLFQLLTFEVKQPPLKPPLWQRFLYTQLPRWRGPRREQWERLYGPRLLPAPWSRGLPRTAKKQHWTNIWKPRDRKG